MMALNRDDGLNMFVGAMVRVWGDEIKYGLWGYKKNCR